MNEVAGLPAHVLLVHAVVVLVPVTALLTLLYGGWPAGRTRLRWLLVGCAALSVIFVVVAMQAGEWLQQRVPAAPLVRAHTRLGDTLLPWAFGMLLFSVVTAAVQVRAQARARRAADRNPASAAGVAPRRGGAICRVAVPAVAVVLAAGALVTTYRIGETGSRAVWHDRVSVQPLPSR